MRAPRTSTEQRPPRRRGVRWVLGSLAGLVLLAAVTLGTLGETPGGLLGLPVAPERSLEAAIHDRFAGAGAGDIVVLSDVTDIEWDEVGVFGPYYPHDAVVEVMGVRVPRGATSNLHYDERCLLVFRRGDRVAAWTVVSRDVADCTGEASGQLYTPDHARFSGDRLYPAIDR
jgi:hypothetical protein